MEPKYHWHNNGEETHVWLQVDDYVDYLGIATEIAKDPQYRPAEQLPLPDAFKTSTS